MMTQAASTISPRQEFFPRAVGRHADARYLPLWRAARLTYTPGDEQAGAGWHQDRYQHVICRVADEHRFALAADRLMRYRFYPAHLIEHVSDFERENRWAKLGDHLIQRIHVLRTFSLIWADVVTQAEISAVIQEPRRAGFAYTTTDAHPELGRWQVEIIWRETGELVLVMEAVSKPGPRVAVWQRRYARWLQLQAHQAGIAAFSQAVNTL